VTKPPINIRLLKWNTALKTCKTMILCNNNGMDGPDGWCKMQPNCNNFKMAYIVVWALHGFDRQPMYHSVFSSQWLTTGWPGWVGQWLTVPWRSVTGCHWWKFHPGRWLRRRLETPNDASSRTCAARCRNDRTRRRASPAQYSRANSATSREITRSSVTARKHGVFLCL